ncbi:MAG: BLUF domain-containing protein [Burkholderiaceae bacterium]|nr:BLUF domain-containing protein [Burkholderiaceae bacterium]
MLAQLIYASEASAPMGVGDIEGILKTARRKNRLLDLTGTLLFDRQFFLQVIEGDPQQLSDLYARLVADNRHKRLKIIQFDEISERRFGDWSMGFAAASTSHQQVYLQHGATRLFDPYHLSASAALGILRALGNPGALDTAEKLAA